MSIQYLNPAKKSIRAMDAQNRIRLEKALELLPMGDVQPMYYKDTYRLRVGKYRVVFAYTGKDSVLVHKIGSRGDIYKGINC